MKESSNLRTKIVNVNHANVSRVLPLHQFAQRANPQITSTDAQIELSSIFHPFYCAAHMISIFFN